MLITHIFFVTPTTTIEANAINMDLRYWITIVFTFSLYPYDYLNRTIIIIKDATDEIAVPTTIPHKPISLTKIKLQIMFIIVANTLLTVVLFVSPYE